MKLSQSKILLLDSINFIWHPFEAAWQKGFDELTLYLNENPNCQIPALYKTKNGYSLGTWVVNQRQNFKKLTIEQIKILEALPGWSWDLSLDSWHQMLALLHTYANTHGNCLVPQTYKSPDGKALGRWIPNQRQRMTKLSIEQKKLLEAVKGWSWDRNDEKWDTGISELNEYLKSNGNLLVPQIYKTKNDFNLGSWVANQRNKFKNNLLTPEQIDKLNSFKCWVWNTNEYAWENGFNHLIEYGKLNNTYLVKRDYLSPDGFKLGEWVKLQRGLKDKLATVKKEKLESLKDWAWSARSIQSHPT